MRWPEEGRLRLVGIPGTNKVMAGELSRLARRALGTRLPEPTKEGTGQLVYPFSQELAHLAVHYHRTCARVLWDLFVSGATRLEPLYAELYEQMKSDSRAWLWDGARVSIRGRNLSSFAAARGQVIGAVKNAVIDGAAARGLRLQVDPATPDVVLAARIHDDAVTVSVDLAGAAMHQRGYRSEGGGEAPLRENLAAVLLMLTRHAPRTEVLLDPMAGSGTIAIEAALMARASPVWAAPRSPDLVRLPAFSSLAGRAVEPLFADTTPIVICNELDPRAADLARRNIDAAGVAGDVTQLQGDFRAVTPARVAQLVGTRGSPGDAPGLIVSNPPYGQRVGGPDVVALYRDIATWLDAFKGWRAGFLVANRDFEAAIGRRPRIKKPLSNGPMRGYFYLYEL